VLDSQNSEPVPDGTKRYWFSHEVIMIQKNLQPSIDSPCSGDANGAFGEALRRPEVADPLTRSLRDPHPKD
jgi:hypothetical protein